MANVELPVFLLDRLAQLLKLSFLPLVILDFLQLGSQFNDSLLERILLTL